MSEWGECAGAEWHKVAHSGRPFLAFGVPRYGFPAERCAIVYFETGHGCREANNNAPFTVKFWQPLPTNPQRQELEG